jgi:hypothetical protein
MGDKRSKLNRRSRGDSLWDEGRFKYKARDVCGKLLLGEKRSCGGENVRSGSEEIRQSNCNTYISCYADLLCS